MAGIEQLEIHSKSYIVRWVKVEAGHTISWSLQPHKKSINFGIVKHPGTGATSLASSSHPDDAAASSEAAHADAASSDGGRGAKKDSSTAQAQLRKKGFLLMQWYGRCEPDKVSTGTYDVTSAGMFGLVFDNTFSKQTSKTATFVLLTYPTGAPPQTTHPLPNLQANPAASASRSSLGRQPPQHSSPRLGGVVAGSESVDSLHSHAAAGGGGGPGALSVTGRSDSGTTSAAAAATTYHVGTLLKRRRKKGQGYARRFFSLDYTTCTLSYYHNRNSSALRGAIPLSLAAIAADERRREISIDSGAEVWHLKASNDKEFADWARALERASRIARGLESLPANATTITTTTTAAAAAATTTTSSAAAAAPGTSSVVPVVATAPPGGPVPNTHQEDEREWQQVEALVSRIVGTRDALRRLVKDMAAAAAAHNDKHGHPADEHSPHRHPHQQPAERRSFWKRKTSATPAAPQNLVPPSSSSGALGNSAVVTAHGESPKRKASTRHAGAEERNLHEHCAALLGDLDSVVLEFSNLLATSKRRRLPSLHLRHHHHHHHPSIAPSRRSYESTTSTEEFFDAEAGDPDASQLMMIDHRHSEEEEEEDTPASDADEASVHDSSSVSSVDEEGGGGGGGALLLHPVPPKSLAPLPIYEPVARRTTIPPATALPPSLIAFVRKNVGKDLSTISMPVSANEPLSLLQRMAEQLEYADLLDAAARHPDPRRRLLLVTAFAVSQFSAGRARERAIRKPFNPLLGETFELVRTEREVPGGFRLLVEKVSHRPVRLAMQADSARWSFAQSPAPTQKFWGKSMELTTEGRVRVTLRLPAADHGSLGSTTTEERYSWNVATVFLRNVVMGEKYVEPVGTMHVANDSTGARAAVEFRSKGMFGGRGEEVQVETYGPEGAAWGLGLAGTWTTALRTTGRGAGGAGAGEEIWRVGSLVPNAASTYGMTLFGVGLNEITALEQGRLPPTDSRLRPDQRLVEQGRLDEAEASKVRLEEAQRARRRALEEKGLAYRPRWFVLAATAQDGEEVWRIKGGKDGYWEERARGEWSGVEDIFRA